MSNIYWSADAHISHPSILKFMPNRPYASEGNTHAHDEWIINLWQKTIGKYDKIYYAGDLTFRKSEDARRLLEQLPGEKYLAVGNHDGAIKAHSKYFRKVAQIMEVTIKPSMFETLSEELHIVLCHYPLLDWPGKQQGAIMLHGHCHGTMDDFNASSADLRFDIGIDGILAKQAGGFIDMKTLYEAILKKTGGLTTQQYANEKY